ncbi:low-density lipoprotein receptor class A domain-containing protein 4 [Fukomys damarensis]|uniref:low-density lipoprotein receptor class A domain-containing protein 4 n=1 Tax=Fukomys damarensis TaxID=885580 RepID=UPI001455D1D6|nr:low-density lipoprotein receptor class A domain-containing protein 4 [Fukomys damarensis]
MRSKSMKLTLHAGASGLGPVRRDLGSVEAAWAGGRRQPISESGTARSGTGGECKFTCTSGKCLYLGSLVCNQQNDCGDNSDEDNCLLVTERPPPAIFSSELEFAQIIIIVVVVTVMLVVVVCLLSHYKVSTRSFIQRPGPGRRPGEGPPREGHLWPPDAAVLRPGALEVRGVRVGATAPGTALEGTLMHLNPLPPWEGTG